MENFSIRISRSQTINGSLLASMTKTDALKHFKESRFTTAQIEKAHAEAKAKAKELGSGAEVEAAAE